MERELLQQLKLWKARTNRKPLILQGARQVGKTWLLKEFGRQYFEDMYYVNLEQDLTMAQIFDNFLTPSHIIERLGQACHIHATTMGLSTSLCSPLRHCLNYCNNDIKAS